MGDGQAFVVVGAATRDIDASDSRGWRLGGGVTYAAITAARLGMDVKALIGVDSEAASAAEFDASDKQARRWCWSRSRAGPVFDNRQTAGGRVQIRGRRRAI